MLNPKLETPAFADLLAEQVLWQARAASRRQAKLQTNSNTENTKLKTV
jgi:hypothetical protein